MGEGDKGLSHSETPVNPYSLLEAVNASSDTVNTGWLIFLAIMAYVLIAVAGVTHKDILLETPVALPIMQVSIQLRQFFTFAPIVIVLFHLGVVAQLVLLARKTIEFDHAVRLLELSDKRTHPLRLELHNFFFVQAIAGPHRSRVVSAFLHGMSWLTTVIIPVVLLLYIQVAFLPYHDVTTTWVHRIALVVDLGVLLLIGTFLLSTETSFFEAMARNARAHPLNVGVTTAVLLFVGFLSFFVATVPGERLDQTAQLAFGAPKPEVVRDKAQMSGGFALPFASANTGGSLFGIFRRNLLVTDTDLIADKDVQGGESTISLRGRDLRYARLDRSDLHQSDLTGADLSHASLVGADLRRITLQCGDLNELILTEDRAAARCALARDANFARARLEGARMAGADLRGTRFDDTDMTAADLSYATITGASFSSARLDKADLTGGMRAEGANFLLASLQGADLTGALLQGADLSTANLQGAILSFADLQGAVLRNAELEAASLHRSKLQGADLSGAKITAADLRGAAVWMTPPPVIDGAGLADFRELKINELETADITALKRLIEKIRDEPSGPRVRELLEPLIAAKDDPMWGSGEAFAAWETRAQPGVEPPDAARARLSDHLAALRCRPRGAIGAIATGIVRRAQSQQFAGDPAALYERSKREDCLAARSVAEPLLRGLAAAAETVKSP